MAPIVIDPTISCANRPLPRGASRILVATVTGMQGETELLPRYSTVLQDMLDQNPHAHCVLVVTGNASKGTYENRRTYNRSFIQWLTDPELFGTHNRGRLHVMYVVGNRDCTEFNGEDMKVWGAQGVPVYFGNGFQDGRLPEHLLDWQIEYWNTRQGGKALEVAVAGYGMHDLKRYPPMPGWEIEPPAQTYRRFSLDIEESQLDLIGLADGLDEAKKLAAVMDPTRPALIVGGFDGPATNSFKKLTNTWQILYIKAPAPAPRHVGIVVAELTLTGNGRFRRPIKGEHQVIQGEALMRVPPHVRTAEKVQLVVGPHLDFKAKPVADLKEPMDRGRIKLEKGPWVPGREWWREGTLQQFRANCIDAQLGRLTFVQHNSPRTDWPEHPNTPLPVKLKTGEVIKMIPYENGNELTTMEVSPRQLSGMVETLLHDKNNPRDDVPEGERRTDNISWSDRLKVAEVDMSRPAYEPNDLESGRVQEMWLDGKLFLKDGTYYDPNGNVIPQKALDDQTIPLAVTAWLLTENSYYEPFLNGANAKKHAFEYHIILRELERLRNLNGGELPPIEATHNWLPAGTYPVLGDTPQANSNASMAEL